MNNKIFLVIVDGNTFVGLYGSYQLAFDDVKQSAYRRAKNYFGKNDDARVDVFDDCVVLIDPVNGNELDTYTIREFEIHEDTIIK